MIMAQVPNAHAYLHHCCLKKFQLNSFYIHYVYTDKRHKRDQGSSPINGTPWRTSESFTPRRTAIDTYGALIIADLMTPFGIFLMRQICVDIPNELIDATRVDGVSELGIGWRIVMPNVTAGLVTLALFDFQGVWNSFYWPFLVISSDHLRTVPLALALFSTQRGSQPQYMMA